MYLRRFCSAALASSLLAGFGLCCGVAACERTRATSPAALSSSIVSPLSPPEASSATSTVLAPGVLAQAVGRRGVIRVELRSGLRVLTIDGVVQGAAPDQAGAALLGTDPLVDLARLVRPGARSALLVGLGTGATATALARAGIDVEAAELEPSVVEFARRYFDYRGHAVVADGLEYARESKRVFDLVIIDTFDGSGASDSFASAEAIRVLRERRAGDGVTLIRTHDAPASDRARGQWRTLGDRFRLAFGSGTGSERQNLILLGSNSPMTVEDGTNVSMWPVDLDGAVRTGLQESPGGGNGAEREVVVTGYLVRDDTGAVFVDLPHLEMGGVRYVLDDAGAGATASLLPAGTRFPTQGDIRTDGDTAGTMREAMGGGGVKRSDVRFSPVVVRIRGKARLRAVIDPDARMSGAGKSAPRPSNALLPYGGVLYEIRGGQVLWSLRHSQWKTARRVRLEPIARRACAELVRGRLTEGARELQRYLDDARATLGEPVLRLPAIDEIALLRSRLALSGLSDARPGQTARACDRAAFGLPAFDDGSSADAMRVREALVTCATTFYERSALSGRGDEALNSARRLLALLEDSPSKRSVREALRKRYGELEELGAPAGD